MRKLDFIFFDAGGGHRSAANALKAVVEEQGRDWQIRLVNLQEVLDRLDVSRRITGIRLEDIYNLMLKKGWTLGSPQLTVGMHLMIRLFHRQQVKLLTGFWSQGAPDMVVSLVPNFNRAMFEALKKAAPAVPYVTVITDLADYPPHFWIERQQQYLICGTDKAVEQAREFGHRPEFIRRSSGMILRPSFYQAQEVDRESERRKLHLHPEMPTALVLFGGQGSGVMVDILQRLERANASLQLVFICGRNERLAERLRSIRTDLRKHVVGFTSEVPRYMAISDFMIGKPGPGSISEALLMKLPVIIDSNAWTLPQERYNAQWVLERQVGVVVRNFRRIVPAVQEMLQPGTLDRFRANAAALKNRAVFEIPEMLEEILNRSYPS
ncbi:MAG: glycosyltransferase [Acidobacteria bacterium]|nr:glycosyltransferase [Acidobacteriota bacterium]